MLNEVSPHRVRAARAVGDLLRDPTLGNDAAPLGVGLLCGLGAAFAGPYLAHSFGRRHGYDQGDENPAATAR